MPPLSPLFEALERRTSEDAARRTTGPGKDGRSVDAWDRERAFAAMERLRAGIVVLGGLRDAQLELLQWNRERIKTGRSPALLQARLCREAALSAWCPLLPATFGAAGRRNAGAAARSANTPAERTPPNLSGNGPIKDELQ